MLLTDAQVQSFIRSGLMEIALPDLDNVHHEVNSRLRELCEAESHHGNNILPRMPILQRVLRHEKIHGALISLLGSDYLIHPHRAIHRSTPIAEGLEDFSLSSNRHLMGAGSTATSLWHQDAQSPLARARHHFPKFLIGFYFPHEVDISMGPTRFLRASYCDNGPDLSREIYQPDRISAGTFFLAHFDIAHAGFPNVSKDDRFMLKFVFARTSSPAAPSWNNESDIWLSDEHQSVESSLPEPTAIYIWNRMLGQTNPRLVSEQPGSSVSEEITPLNERLRLIYDSKKGQSLAASLDALRLIQGEKKHERLQEGLRDNTHGNPIRWNERAIVMEVATYRLAALGSESMDAVHSLIESGDPWLQVNAAFVAGEITSGESERYHCVTELLESSHHQVVRQAIDALSFIKLNDHCNILRQLKKLVANKLPDWRSAQVRRGWTAADQIDMNIAMFVLANCKQWDAEDLISISAIMLQSSNDYASSIVAEALIRSESLKAQKHAISYYQDRAWNTSLLGEHRAY